MIKKLSSFIFTMTILFAVAGEVSASCSGLIQHPPCAEFWRADASELKRGIFACRKINS